MLSDRKQRIDPRQLNRRAAGAKDLIARAGGSIQAARECQRWRKSEVRSGLRYAVRVRRAPASLAGPGRGTQCGHERTVNISVQIVDIRHAGLSTARPLSLGRAQRSVRAAQDGVHTFHGFCNIRAQANPLLSVTRPIPRSCVHPLYLI